MTEQLTRVHYDAAANAVRQHTTQQPTLGLILGSGLSSLADSLSQPDIIPYEKIPHWPVATVHGHQGQLVIGQMEEHTVVVLQGRSHFYEGYSVQQTTMPVRVMQLLGVKTLLVTNAAGGMNPDFRPGDLMLIRDHINFPGMAGNNPLRGANDETLGPRFPDMTEPYSARLRTLARAAAAAHNIPLHEGVYTYVAGPSYETPAELGFLRACGGDAVGMSTVPEVIVARHGGLDVLGVSTITNMAIPNPPPGTVLSHAEVIEVGKLVIPRLTTLLRAILSQLTPEQEK
jgi:purine-nucleoside phosphorylase